jgi:hypothetical protein
LNMSEQKAAAETTNVAGYFNPHSYPIFVEISEINLKAELAPGAYIRDRTGRYINDPIFEGWCHAKGLSRAKSEKPVPIIYVPRFVKATRPPASVSAASGFVRDPGGRTVPTFPAQAPTKRPVEANKTPHVGMTMEAARKLGLAGRPKLVDDEYGADETNGAPLKGPIPPIKYSTETPTRINAGALRQELLETDADLPPEERQRRVELQRSISAASATPTGDDFDPARVRPIAGAAPVPLKAPDSPTAFTGSAPAPAAPPKAKQVKPKAPAKPSAVKVTPARRVAAPVAPPPPVAPVAIQPASAVEESAEPVEEVEPGSGVVQPLDESVQESPVMESPATTEDGKSFICAADGKPFKYRSELLRHVERNYPDMVEVYMAPYPP